MNQNIIPSQNMSHRKVYSQGSIPFSWEDSPGISKAFLHQKFPNKEKTVVRNDATIEPTSSPPPPSSTSFFGNHHADNNNNNNNTTLAQESKIPLPPCQQLSQPPRRSTSAKGFRWWPEDPFLAAYKECTKEEKNLRPLPNESKKFTHGSKVFIKKSKAIFSCKNARDVADDNLVRLSGTLAPIPRDRVRGR